MSAETNVADALRLVTSKMQKAVEEGRRSRYVDAEDLIDVLLSVADELDPEFDEPAGE